MAKNHFVLDTGTAVVTIKDNPCLEWFQADPYGKSRLKHSRVDVPEGEPESLLLLIEWQKTRAFF